MMRMSAYGQLTEESESIIVNQSLGSGTGTLPVTTGEENQLSPVVTIPLVLYVIAVFSLIVTIISYLAIKKLRTSDAGQMVLNMSVSLICHYTTFSPTVFENNDIGAVCFVFSMLSDYFGFVYGFLVAAEAVNMFVKVVLVFKKIDHFPLKASLVAWIVPSLIVGFTYCNLYSSFNRKCQIEVFKTYFGELFVAFMLNAFNWSIFIVIIITLLRKSRKVVTAEQLATTREIKKDLLIITTLFVLLGISSGLTIVFIFASFAAEDRSSVISPLPLIGRIIVLFQGPALFLLQGVRLREIRQLWYKWLCCQCTCRNHLKISHHSGTSRTGELICNSSVCK